MLAATPHRAQPRTAALATAIRCALMCGALAMTVSPAKAAIAFSDLNGANGFRLHGAAVNDSAGRAVAPAGDFNDDGLPDLLISAPNADPGGRGNAGITYIVFGRQGSDGFASTIDLGALETGRGLRIHGVAADDFSGYDAAAAGDINGDGVDDVIIGAPLADPGGRMDAGSSYVVFGNSGFTSASVLELSSLGSGGFRLDGVGAADNSASVVAGAGDINGDGIDDVVVGAQRAQPGGMLLAGSSYVVFGSSSSTGFASAIELGGLNGSNGFQLDGGHERDRAGEAISRAGDINGDGVGDLIIGALGADPGGVDYAGSTYVLFGRSGSAAFASRIELTALDGSNGFRLDGSEPTGTSGIAVAAAGDINGDGHDDLIIGARGEMPHPLFAAGSSHVLFGRSVGNAFASPLMLSALNGSDGFRLDGTVSYDFSGHAVAAAGDVNGDNIDDLLVSAPYASPGGSQHAGSTYIVFGRQFDNFASAIALSALGPRTGYRLDGLAAEDYSGRSIATAGDINSDGIDDLIVGARSASPPGISHGGVAYVVFGARPPEIFDDGFE
jgi:hypothetical protein